MTGDDRAGIADAEEGGRRRQALARHGGDDRLELRAEKDQEGLVVEQRRPAPAKVTAQHSESELERRRHIDEQGEGDPHLSR